MRESCLTYIISELHWLNMWVWRGQAREKTLLPWSLTSQRSPLNSASLYRSLQLPLNLSQTFCHSLTHSSLTPHSSPYSAVKGQSEGVWGACERDWSSCTSASHLGFLWFQVQINQRNRNLEFWRCEWVLLGLDNRIQSQSIYQLLLVNVIHLPQLQAVFWVILNTATGCVISPPAAVEGNIFVHVRPAVAVS